MSREMNAFFSHCKISYLSLHIETATNTSKHCSVCMATIRHEQAAQNMRKQQREYSALDKQ
jgi:hypothetical protein